MSTMSTDDRAEDAAGAPGGQRQARYWRLTVRVTLALLAIWFAVTFVAGFFPNHLDFVIFGWPFAFWLGAQGAPLIFLAVVWGYVFWMERLEE